MPCVCVEKAWRQDIERRMLERCAIPPEGLKMTFESLKLEKKTASLKAAYDAAMQVAESDDGHNWLLLMGSTGCGKTHLLMAICQRWLQKGKPARYVHVTALMEELRRGLYSERQEHSYTKEFDLALNIPLLAMDDLGTENRTPWVQEKLNYLVDYRMMRNLALVITTNQPWPDIPFRIRSRFERHGRIISIEDPDYYASGGKR